MSRGPGAVQRRILAALSDTGDSWTPVRELAGESPAEQESARRAVHALAAAGKVETRRIQRAVPQWSWTGGYTTTVDRMVLACRCS
ncbi:MAG TPA: hypothetical protein VN888_06425 [Mycobacterium sp.]|nr:hypothetical protein [Mycobacterium sp.]